LVVDLDAGNIALVAGNDRRVSFTGLLLGHVVVAGSIEVFVSPSGEGLLAESRICTMVLERVLSVRLEEL